MKNPIIKGTWYYEIQILMFVFMWQHDMNFKSVGNWGLHIGRFCVWYDSCWKYHGLPYQINYFFWKWKLKLTGKWRY